MASTITGLAHLQIPLEEVSKATNNFHYDNVIGYFGQAYVGRLLRSEKLVMIVARRLDRMYGPGSTNFLNEVSVLSDLNHENLISMIGFCDERGENIIITTYAANGSLREFLNSPSLTWTQRLRICVGVARALSYLHSDEGRGFVVLHRLINSSTILLDENWEAKLSGFEISIKQPVYFKDHIYPGEPMGAIGYMDPSSETTKCVTLKSDIYSFGVVLFEILCGRIAFIRDEANSFLAPLAKKYFEEKKLKDIIYPDIRNQMSPQSLLIYSKVAYSCLKDEQAHRPEMYEIVDELKKALELQLRLENLVQGENIEHLKIPLSDIKLATENFSRSYEIAPTILYSNLYKVELDHLGKENTSFVEGKDKGEPTKKHNTVAIKRITPGDDYTSKDMSEDMFCVDLEMLTTVKHRNIVTLKGVCVEDCEMILVKENPLNGYLGDYLGKENGMRNFTWEKRLKICIDVAQAINYLHFEMEDQRVIINRNITSFNIVLDEAWEAKIADFGFSIFLPSNQDDESLHLNQIYGKQFYIDPEYEKTGRLKRESDVYSFGVILFEILGGRLATDKIYCENNDKGVARVARQSFHMGTIQKMIDPILKEETSENNFTQIIGPNKDSLNTFIEIAYHCIAEAQHQRPTMKDVVNELQKALSFQVKRGQHEDMNQVVYEFEKASQLNLTTNEISVKRGQHEDMNPVVYEFEKPSQLNLPINEISGKNLEHLKIPLNDIMLATFNFNRRYRLDCTDLYTWYKANFDHIDKENPSSINGKINQGELYKRHNYALIKRIHPRDDKENEKVFYRELEMLSCVKHPNIVTLLGFCHEESEMVLVIEKVSKGSLDMYLRKELQRSDMSSFNWEKRLKICIDVANALKYLHFDMDDQKVIINCDIRSGNIVLDENLGAKIVDFGFSVFLSPNQEEEALYLKTPVGSPYYKDPEYIKSGKLKRESDVYSFGVVMFEILCGTIADDPIHLMKSEKGLQDVARRSFCTGTTMDLIDPMIKEETMESNFVLNRGPNKDSLATFINIAYKCVAETQDKRPTMKDVVNELRKASLFQINNKDNLIISLEDIKLATQNFHDYIGGGGFGQVYKGKLQDRDIVAKRLHKNSDQGDEQFLSELQILLEYKHKHVIGLVGCCDEKNEKIIVYEHASKGSLYRCLKDASLEWMKRLKICIDVATALEFLHGGVGNQAKVVHRDIKSDNILLDHDWTAKLGDFGLSLISPINQRTDYVINHVCGTPGYMDPLYQKSRFLTIESDIYSFGVVMFEILCGRSTFEIPKDEGPYLPDFIERSFKEGKHDEVVFQPIRGQIAQKSLTTFQAIAYRCLHQERQERPTAKEVLQELNKAMEFQLHADSDSRCDRASTTKGPKIESTLSQRAPRQRVWRRCLMVCGLEF